VNKLHEPVPDDNEALDLDAGLLAKVEASASESQFLAERDAAGLSRLRAALGEPAVVAVPQLADDVHDLDGLARVGDHLFTDPPPAAA
jgi:hypothetical protein